MTGAPTLVLAFMAGALTIVSPCVLPLAPIVIAGGRAKDPRAPLALAAGLALTFGLTGGALASLGVVFGDSSWVRALSAGLMIALGLAMVIPALGIGAERVMAPIGGLAAAMERRLPNAGLWGQAGLGAVLAFAWAPCAGPTLGAAFALAASGGSVLAAMAIMTVFALGAALALLSAGYGLGRLAASGRQRAGHSGQIGRKALGIAFALIGAAILTGFDHQIEAAFIAAMPQWLVNFAVQI